MPPTVWANPAVKQVATYGLGAGLAALSAGGLLRILRHVSSTSAEQSFNKLLKYFSPADVDAWTSSLRYDTELIDLLDRMSDFASMAPTEFTALLRVSVELCDERRAFDELGSKAFMTEAMAVRSRCQAFIEAIRLMRAVLELQNASVLEDFDEVASDCQTYHTEVNQDVLFAAQSNK